MLTRWEQAVLAYVEDLEYVTSTAILLDALPWRCTSSWGAFCGSMAGSVRRGAIPMATW